MRIWGLLANEEKMYEMVKHLLNRGIFQDIEILIVEYLQFEIGADGGLSFFYKGEEKELPDAFWPMISNTDSFTIEKLLIENGVPSLINMDEVAVARSKTITVQRLAARGIPVPRTEVFFDKMDKEKLLRDFEFPFVVKPDNGFGGVGVELVHNEKELNSYLENLQPNVVYNAQEYISTSKGKDLRVVVLDGKCIFSVLRQAGDEKEFRSNVHQGGSMKAYELDDSTREFCEKVASAFDLAFLGLDLMFAENGFVIAEVNSFPGVHPDILIQAGESIVGAFLAKQKGGK